jgi:fructokinase
MTMSCILAVGEVLWDLLPAGKQLGGAPANFAFHAHSLGAEACIVSRVGHDSLGQEILARLGALGLSTEGVTLDPCLPTGTVSVELSDDGQPRFTIHEGVAWDNIAVDSRMSTWASHADVVCFGSLAQRSEASRNAIASLVEATPAGAIRVFDINLRQHFYSQAVVARSLELANVLKLNDAELPVLAAMFSLSGDVREQIVALASRFDLRLVALTRGSQGSLLHAKGQWSDHPGERATVKDTVGAGDSFTAAVAMGMLAGSRLDDINAFANRVAAFVCSQSGATPCLPDSLRSHAVLRTSASAHGGVS